MVSSRSGLGKSLYIERYKEHLERNYEGAKAITVPLHDESVDYDGVVQALHSHIHRTTFAPRIYHLDVSPMVCQIKVMMVVAYMHALRFL